MSDEATHAPDAEAEAHALTLNVNETAVEGSDGDVEGHGMNLGNVNETAVEDSDEEAEA